MPALLEMNLSYPAEYWWLCREFDWSLNLLLSVMVFMKSFCRNFGKVFCHLIAGKYRSLSMCLWGIFCLWKHWYSKQLKLMGTIDWKILLYQHHWKDWEVCNSMKHQPLAPPFGNHHLAFVVKPSWYNSSYNSLDAKVPPCQTVEIIRT